MNWLFYQDDSQSLLPKINGEVSCLQNYVGAEVRLGYSRSLVGVALAAVSSLAAQGAQAQADAIFGMVGGMMAAAQAQAAGEAWSRQPELRQYCVQRGLSRQNVTIQGLIRSGVMPNDARIHQVISQCARFEPSALKEGYRCTVPDESGMLASSVCDQRFARQDGSGRVQYLDTRAAIDLYFSNGSYTLADAENEVGREERIQRIEGQRRIADLSRLRGEVESYRASRSEIVRAQTNSLLQRVASASNPNAMPPSTTVEAIRRDAEALARLEGLELARLAALEKLTAARRTIEARAPSLPGDLKEAASRLNVEDLSVVNQSLVVVPPPTRVEERAAGPSFDCARAKAPLEQVICSDPALSRLDLEVLQPYYVLRHIVPEQRQALKEDAVEFGKRVQEECRLPEKGNLPASAARRAVPCVTTAYRRQRDVWRARAEQVAPSARQEIARPIGEHLRLQGLLQQAGLIPGNERVDGVYGGGTRSGISGLQASEGLPADGILSDAAVERLLRRTGATHRDPGPALDSAVTGRLVDLHRRYLALSSRVDEADAKRAREEQIKAKIASGRAFAKEALSLTLPAHVQGALTGFLADVDSAGEMPDGPTLVRLASGLDALRPLADEAVSIAKATTPKNGFLLQGPLDEVVILFNDTGRAPSVVKNLRGDLVFEAGKTLACQPNGGFGDVAVSREVNARLAKWEQALKLPLQRCNARTLTGYDLLVVSRGDLLKEKAADVIALLSAVEAGAFATMVSITGEEIKAAVQAEAVRVLGIETAVEREAKPGFGAVVLPSTASGIVCMVSGDEREAHEALIKPYLGRIAEETKNRPTLVTTSADAAFVAAKRGQCGAIYASGADLKDLTAALRRDQIAFRFLPVWMEPQQAMASKAALADGRTREVQQEADRRRRIEDEQRLEQLKQSEDAVVEARRQAELQRQYGAMARGLVGLLAIEMKDFVEMRSKRAGAKYPAIGEWYAVQLQDRWELMSVDTSLVDYGVAEFKGRSLETAFARTTIKMRNRVLGEYKEHCFVTGFISDKEFEMDREPINARCEGAAGTLATYRQGQRFSSRWLVQ